MTITVRVVDEDDDERTFEGKTVTIYGKSAVAKIPILGAGTESLVESTDDDGEAVFDLDDAYFDTSEPITIEVEGSDVEWGPYDISDDEHDYTFTVTI